MCCLYFNKTGGKNKPPRGMPSLEKKHMNHAVQEWIAMFQIAVDGNKKRIKENKWKEIFDQAGLFMFFMV